MFFRASLFLLLDRAQSRPPCPSNYPCDEDFPAAAITGTFQQIQYRQGCTCRHWNNVNVNQTMYSEFPWECRHTLLTIGKMNFYDTIIMTYPAMMEGLYATVPVQVQTSRIHGAQSEIATAAHPSDGQQKSGCGIGHGSLKSGSPPPPWTPEQRFVRPHAHALAPARPRAAPDQPGRSSLPVRGLGCGRGGAKRARRPPTRAPAAPAQVSYGMMLGKVGPTQLMVCSIMCVLSYGLNFWLTM